MIALILWSISIRAYTSIIFAHGFLLFYVLGRSKILSISLTILLPAKRFEITSAYILSAFSYSSSFFSGDLLFWNNRIFSGISFLVGASTFSNFFHQMYSPYPSSNTSCKYSAQLFKRSSISPTKECYFLFWFVILWQNLF